VSERPLVSVIVIFFQAERFLEQAIESILAQSYTPIELILVDDGSTDAGMGMARSYAAGDERIHYVTHPGRENRGMSASRNLGLDHARGQLVAFLDADDVWLPEKLERQVDLLAAMPEVGLVWGPTEWWYSWSGDPADAERDVALDIRVPLDSIQEPPALLQGMVERTASPPATCSALVRRAVFDRVGRFEEGFRGLYEDQVFFAKVLLQERSYASSLCLDRYRQHDASAVAAAFTAGELHAYQPNEPRRVFLEWLAAYVSRERPHDDPLRASIERALQPYRWPTAPLEIVEARRVRDDEGCLWGACLDHPVAGELHCEHGLRLVGWALGRSAPVATIDVVCEGRRLASVVPSVPRRDLERAFPDLPDAAQGGFEIAIPHLLATDWHELSVDATLTDGTRVPIALLRVERRWREKDLEIGLPLVSAVVVCSAGESLAEVLECVASQTYDRCEAVAVCGDADTSRAARRFAGVLAIEARERLDRESARQTGLAAARGQFVVFLDADSRPASDLLSTAVATAADAPEAAWVAVPAPGDSTSILDRTLFQRAALARRDGALLDETLLDGLGGIDVAAPTGSGSRLARRRSPALQALVLLFHRVADLSTDPWGLAVPPERFARQLDVLLEEHFQFVPLHELVRARGTGRGGRLAAVSFDDGYADVLDAGLPALEERSIPSTLFLVSGTIGHTREMWWDELERIMLEPGELPDTLELDIGGSLLRWRLGKSSSYAPEAAARHRRWRTWEDPPTARHQVFVDLYGLLFLRREADRVPVLDTLAAWAGRPAAVRTSHRLLSAEDVKAVARSPLVEIGAHTVTHPRLTALPPDERWREIVESRQRIGELAGVAPAGFSYPSGTEGDYDSETAALVAEAGFTYACVGHGGAMRSDANPFLLPRACVFDWDDDKLRARMASWLED
jgi:glycosyltransferase involved in cell wall biosynthesis/peptidoglycan/xylan/chitin deacetylase (PgdA/CDA1 family)